jgi:hypothetical protein
MARPQPLAAGIGLKESGRDRKSQLLGANAGRSEHGQPGKNEFNAMHTFSLR